jgi:hypothetical protein
MNMLRTWFQKALFLSYSVVYIIRERAGSRWVMNQYQYHPELFKKKIKRAIENQLEKQQAPVENALKNHITVPDLTVPFCNVTLHQILDE